MATILKNGEVFVHVPKTGGSFIRKVLDELGITKKHLNIGSSHCTTRVLKAHLNWKGDWPFIFCFVRHPITWYESCYKFMTGKRLDPRSVKNFHHLNHPYLPVVNILITLQKQNRLTFDNFIRKILEVRPGFVTELYSCYDTFECSFVGKQEQLEEDLTKVLLLRKYPVNLKKIRKVAPYNLSKSEVKWDEGLKREILETEAICLRRYKYDEVP